MSYIPGPINNAPDVTGTITALGGAVTATVQGYSSCSVVLTGTWTATLIFETTSDGGATWCTGGFVVPPVVATLNPGLSIYVTANGTYQCIGMSATTGVRIKAAAFTSGTVNVRLVISDALPPMLTGFSAVQQNVVASTLNSSTVNLAAGATFTGVVEATLGTASMQVNVIADQPILVNLQESMDGTNWDISETVTFLAGRGDGRTFQTTASYFRVVVTNVGNATTTYFRLQTVLCPIVETLPRALTPAGNLRLSGMTTSWAPDPNNRQDLGLHRALLLDTDRNLNVRARCLTDEASFRDDFAGSSPYTDMTGTYYFTNGSVVVTGVGTLFTTELNLQHNIKLSSHADSVYMLVGEIKSDTYLELSEPYTGATGSGTGRVTYWVPTIGSGAAITQTGSEVLLATGTTSGTLVQIKRLGDYLPYVIGFKARVTQRIANQEIAIGISDGDYGSVNNQAMVVFDGTDNTVCKLRTSWGSGDIETTSVSIPDLGNTATSLYYQLEITNNKVILFINEVVRAEHKLHIPGPYAAMDLRMYAKNTGVAGSTTTLAVDTCFLSNFDRVEINSSARGDPLVVKELRSSSPTVTSVAAAVADTTLLVPSPGRLGCSIYNDSIATLYLKLGSGASTTSFTIALGRFDYYEAPANYVGRINGYWSAATGSARITELT